MPYQALCKIKLSNKIFGGSDILCYNTLIYPRKDGRVFMNQSRYGIETAVKFIGWKKWSYR